MNLLHSHFVTALEEQGWYDEVKFTLFDATVEEFPEDVAEFDGILIPGSLSSSYSDIEWVVKLRSKVRKHLIA